MEGWALKASIAIAMMTDYGYQLFAGFQPVHPIWTDPISSSVAWYETEEEALAHIRIMRMGSRGGYCSSFGSGEIRSEPITKSLFLLKRVEA